MVNFDKLGTRVGQDGYTPITGPWGELPEKKRGIIRAMIRHPEASQKDIAEMVPCDSTHVHKVLHSLSPEQFNNYKGEMVAESSLEVRMDADDNDMVQVSTPIEMMVTVSVPREDLETGVVAALGQGAIEPGIVQVESGD